MNRIKRNEKVLQYFVRINSICNATPMTMERNNERKMVFFIVVQFQKQNQATTFVSSWMRRLINDLMFLPGAFIFAFFFFISKPLCTRER